MIKKFTLAIMLLFSAAGFSPSYATPLNFSHPSVIVFCTDLNQMTELFGAAQKARPARIYPTCLPYRTFSAPIEEHIQNELVKISASMPDFEGDPFAIFSFITDTGETVYLLIYNPDSVRTGTVVNE